VTDTSPAAPPEPEAADPGDLLSDASTELADSYTAAERSGAAITAFLASADADADHVRDAADLLYHLAAALRHLRDADRVLGEYHRLMEGG
jgi:hypothetical protein